MRYARPAMDMLNLAGLLITLCALFSYLNHRLLRLPTTIGLMVFSMALSALLIVVGKSVPSVASWVQQAVLSAEFDHTVMDGMLGFLLFAGALHVDLGRLAEQKLLVGTLATIGVVLCTTLVGCASYALFQALGLDIPFAYCLLFGSLISPTDPIAVLGILATVEAPRTIKTKIAGESLFNDGVGVVVFVVLLKVATGENVSAGSIARVFAVEAAGGIAFGLIIGAIAYQMLRTVDNYQVEVLITLALVMGGYSMALAMHTSGPLAMVVAGLLIGNTGRANAMSETTRDHLDTFWELVDEVLNAVLFVLIGFELLVLSLDSTYLVAGAIAIPMVLLSRFIAVGVPISVMRLKREFSPHAVKVLTWGGLRGGISIALVLSIPPGELRDALLTVTYAVVAFSIVVQGLSFGPLLRRFYGAGGAN